LDLLRLLLLLGLSVQLHRQHPWRLLDQLRLERPVRLSHQWRPQNPSDLSHLLLQLAL
jgi:hypothetical protein